MNRTVLDVLLYFLAHFLEFQKQLLLEETNNNSLGEKIPLSGGLFSQGCDLTMYGTNENSKNLCG